MRCQMTLIPLRGKTEEPDKYWNSLSFPMEEVPRQPAPCRIYTHRRYGIRLSGLESADGENPNVYINDEPAGVQWRQSEKGLLGTFAHPNGGFVFRDCFGYAEITVTLEAGEQRLCLRSGHLEVMVRNDKRLNDSVEEMARYVYAHQEDLLLGGGAGSRIRRGLRENRQADLLAWLALTKEAAGIFEASYPYFKANCRFQIQKTPAVQPLERLQYIAPATLQYAACHPEELQPAAGTTGIRAGGRFWQPRRALGMTNRASMDTYENQVLLGFLKALLEAVRQLKPFCREQLANAGKKEGEGESVPSAQFVLAPMRQTLRASVPLLERLEASLARLLRIYSLLLPIRAPRLHQAPKPSAVFRAVPEYNRIFTCCRRWFQFGLYGSGEEKLRYLLPFPKISGLYESYFLARLFVFLEERGWSRDENQLQSYPPPQGWEAFPENWPASPAFGNVFRFQKDGGVLTVYYQPAVYGGKDPAAKACGVGLYRNTSVFRKDSPEEAEAKRHALPKEGGPSESVLPYCPDFILRLQRNGHARYLVADAKFTSLFNAKCYELPKLAFKYLFSLSPLDAGDTLAGLCILSGQSPEEEAGLWDARDCQPDGAPSIQPFADVMNFPGGAEDAPLEALLKRLASF